MMNDDDLGQCEFDGISAFNCARVVATPHADTTKFASHVWLYGDEPTAPQKRAFARLVDNYEDLWPDVANRLASLHPDLSTTEDVMNSLRDPVAVHIGEHAEESMELVYEFDLPDEGFRGFFFRIDDLRVVDAFIDE